jgi:hypothetical protein
MVWLVGGVKTVNIKKLNFSIPYRYCPHWQHWQLFHTKPPTTQLSGSNLGVVDFFVTKTRFETQRQSYLHIPPLEYPETSHMETQKCTFPVDPNIILQQKTNEFMPNPKNKCYCTMKVYEFCLGCPVFSLKIHRFQRQNFQEINCLLLTLHPGACSWGCLRWHWAPWPNGNVKSMG